MTPADIAPAFLCFRLIPWGDEYLVLQGYALGPVVVLFEGPLADALTFIATHGPDSNPLNRPRALRLEYQTPKRIEVDLELDLTL